MLSTGIHRQGPFHLAPKLLRKGRGSLGHVEPLRGSKSLQTQLPLKQLLSSFGEPSSAWTTCGASASSVCALTVRKDGKDSRHAQSTNTVGLPPVYDPKTVVKLQLSSFRHYSDALVDAFCLLALQYDWFNANEANKWVQSSSTLNLSRSFGVHQPAQYNNTEQRRWWGNRMQLDTKVWC